MKKLAIFVILGFLPFTASQAVDTEKLTQKSRAAIKQFGGELKATLQAAMKAGGPVNAISVCKEMAPEIAGNISDKEGVLVARTSLKFRNPDNKPDAWEKSVLEDFEKRKVKGEDVKTMEHSEVVEHTGQKIFRYMKPIPTGDICLTCHGGDIKEPVAKQLNTLYPEDKARGFKKGDIRGAFTITTAID
jgi:hypothetical protein